MCLTRRIPHSGASLARFLLGCRPSAITQVLSRKLNQRYFRGSLYMETDVEVGSSVAAESVVRRAHGRGQTTRLWLSNYCCVVDASSTNARPAASAAALKEMVCRRHQQYTGRMQEANRRQTNNARPLPGASTPTLPPTSPSPPPSSAKAIAAVIRRKYNIQPKPIVPGKKSYHWTEI